MRPHRLVRRGVALLALVLLAGCAKDGGTDPDLARERRYQRQVAIYFHKDATGACVGKALPDVVFVKKNEYIRWELFHKCAGEGDIEVTLDVPGDPIEFEPAGDNSEIVRESSDPKNPPHILGVARVNKSTPWPYEFKARTSAKDLGRVDPDVVIYER